MIEIEHLLFLCTWLILYFILQLCTWLVLRPWISSALALPASFAASLLCSCIISWYLALLGFSPVFALGIFLILTGIVLSAAQRARVGIISDLKEGKGYYALFFIVFFAMLLVRMLCPDINYRSEKYMDHAFIASIMRVAIVPPLDPWFAGERLSMYYYLGHWCFATLGMMASVPSWITFQFIIPTVASVSAVQLYGIGKLISKRFTLLPVACIFLVNPSFVYGYIIGTETSALLWKSSRIIPDTINEYPFFTVLCGDVHATGMSIFNQIFFIFLMIYLFTKWQTLPNRERAICALLAGISLGTMPGLHSWDAIFYAPLFILTAMIIWYQAYSMESRETVRGIKTRLFMWITHLYTDIIGIWKKWREMASASAAILYLWILVPVIALLSYAPYLFMMQTFGVQGVGFVYTSTTLSDFLLFFGWFVLLLLCTLYADIKKRPELLVVAVPFILTGYPALGIILMLLAYLIARQEGIFDLLAGWGLLLALFCELVFIIDGYGPESIVYRMNTVFRVYIAAWLLLGVGSICTVGIRAELFMNRVCHNEKRSIIEKFITCLMVVGTLMLILAAPLIEWKTNHESYDSLQSLHGYAWLKRENPDDYAAIEFLRGLPGEYTLVEAEGSDYQYYGRISSATGIPTIMTWKGHELMWRGDNPSGWYGERIADISRIYEQPGQSSEIMAKYNADLLIVGASERKRYQIPSGADVYLPDLNPIFTAGKTTIYQRVQ